MASTYDVAVVGSGPAGASAALDLARAGYAVALVEKAEHPRYKTCGGGLVGRAVHLLAPAAAKAIEEECFSASMHLPGAGLHFSVERSRPIVAMAMRATLDALLAGEAAAAGARLHAGTEVTGVAEGGDGVTLRTSRDAIHARFVVAADGALGPVARQAGFGRLPFLAAALEFEVPVSASTRERFAGSARFDFGVVDPGYAWVFPKQGHLSVGLMRLGRGVGDLARRLERYLAGLAIEPAGAIERHGYVLPLRPREGPLARGRVLLAGDAAGLAEPIAGEGIAHALLSGRLAARALIETRLDAARAAAHYRRLLAADVLPELRLRRLLARLVHGSPAVRDRLFGRLGSRLCQAMADVFSGETSCRALLGDPRSYVCLVRAGLFRR